jgi:hypothetical protein
MRTIMYQGEQTLYLTASYLVTFSLYVNVRVRMGVRVAVRMK